MKKWILCTAAALALFGAAATAEAKPPAPPHDPPGAGAPRIRDRIRLPRIKILLRPVIRHPRRTGILCCFRRTAARSM